MTAKRLGRGLADIIESTSESGASFVMLKTDQIRPGRFQPRTHINEEALEELKSSIEKQGVVEPIIVRPVAHGTYEIVAGERRWSAVQALGKTEIPAIIKALTDQQTLEISLIENIQREQLSAIEEAKGYERLIAEFGYTQEAVASAVGKDRTTVTNALRLLNLPDEIQMGLAEGSISAGHARAILSVEGSLRQIELFTLIKKNQLSVRQVEQLASSGIKKRRRKVRLSDPATQEIEESLRQFLGTKVSIVSRAKGGRIVIEYFSNEDLSRVLDLVGLENANS